MRTRRLYVDGDFGQIHVRLARPAVDQGRAPVVCLHMSPKSGRSFTPLLERLAADRVALAPDYPGYGASDAPPAEPPVTIGDYARAAWTVVDALALGPVDLVGTHTGSLVAVEAATQRPEHVRRLALISAPIVTAEELAAFRARYEPIPLDRAGTRFRLLWERLVPQREAEMSLETMADSFVETLEGGEAYEWGHRAAFDYMETRFPAALAALRHEVLVFNPADDLAEATRRAAPLLPAGAIVEKPDWGGGCVEGRADDLAAALRAFFDRGAPIDGSSSRTS